MGSSDEEDDPEEVAAPEEVVAPEVEVLDDPLGDWVPEIEVELLVMVPDAELDVGVTTAELDEGAELLLLPTELTDDETELLGADELVEEGEELDVGVT